MHSVTEQNGLANNHRNGTTSFAKLLETYSYRRPQRGEVLEGEVLKIADDAVYLDIGAKRDAIIPHTEIDELEDELIDNLGQGDQIPVYVTRAPLGDEELLVSLQRGLEQKDWDQAKSYLDDDTLLELEIIGHNKGGLLAKFNHIQGFIPNSHVPDLRRVHDKRELMSQKSRMVGSTLPLKVIEVDQRRRRLVLSATAAQREYRQERLQELKVNEVVTGEVVHIVEYGAFIDLDGVHGLLHVSNIAWHHVDRPKDELSVGEEVEVMIEDVDVERERVSLNRKVLLPSPWEQFAENHEVSELIEGEVTAVRDFGAFVQLPIGIEGLIHISEVHTPAGTIDTVLQPGDEVLARIISIEPEDQRLGLSLRRVSMTEELEWMAQREEEAEEAGEEEATETAEAAAAETGEEEAMETAEAAATEEAEAAAEAEPTPADTSAETEPEEAEAESEAVPAQS